ncbi:hypothetical protein [Roseococcus suduntuyensis]|uniref:Uncharacterized protein n=1 Tax=Roseococcus suduntuyensis TaxID=455361 RepID=A0A840A6P6_9PROT|nr:hypothetical protein [Roseococcus suduntuyensis]MBB3897698.1 hypothetical protein [Roseococcus suduntuyensis]
MFIDRAVGIGWGRLLMGLVAASVVATLAFPLLILLAMGLTEGKWSALGAPGDVLPGMLVLLPVSFAMTLAAGLPVHLALAALRRQGWPAYALGGTLAGGGLMFFLGGGGHALDPVQLLGAALGLAAGLGFRAVWRPVPPREG